MFTYLRIAFVGDLFLIYEQFLGLFMISDISLAIFLLFGIFDFLNSLLAAKKLVTSHIFLLMVLATVNNFFALFTGFISFS